MFNWNGIKINIGGTNKRFISDISKYFHASYSESSDKDCDIDISIYNASDDMLPPISRGAKLRKSITSTLEKEFKLKIYSHGEKLWYLFQDMADYWLDLKNNKIVISLHKNLSHFSIIIF